MKATELRIGNWFYSTAKGRNEQFEKHHFCSHNDSSVESYYIEECAEPIPLTEEWLQRFGAKFELVENYYRYFILDYNVWQHYHISKAMPNMKDNLLWSFIVKNNDGKSYELYSITYVHQLQNLYFALTGKELTQNN